MLGITEEQSYKLQWHCRTAGGLRGKRSFMKFMGITVFIFLPGCLHGS